jgi:hypothetical protein
MISIYVGDLVYASVPDAHGRPCLIKAKVLNYTYGPHETDTLLRITGHYAGGGIYRAGHWLYVRHGQVLPRTPAPALTASGAVCSERIEYRDVRGGVDTLIYGG